MIHISKEVFALEVERLQLIAKIADVALEITETGYPETHPQAGQIYSTVVTYMREGHKEVLLTALNTGNDILYTSWTQATALFRAKYARRGLR